MKIIWAVDPFQVHAENTESVSKILKTLASRQKSEIVPTYVSGEAKEALPKSLSAVGSSEAMKEAIQQRAKQALAAHGAQERQETSPTQRPLRILSPGSDTSLRGRIDTLLNYAREVQTDLIVVSTRARKGPSRWFLGSFAETLALVSDVPLLMVNPSLHANESAEGKSCFDHILFATDFSDESHEAFKKILPIARNLKSQLTLFHQARLGLTPTLDIYGISYMIPQDLQDKELKQLKDLAQNWINEAREAGVNAQEKIEGAQVESISSSILRESQRTSGIIALAGESNALEVRLLGSVARQLIREATCPVWLLHCAPKTAT